MGIKGKFGVLAGITVAAFIAIGVIMNVSYDNQLVRYDNLIDAQYQVIEANYDKMWKIIKQQAQVTDKYKDSFKEIYTGIMNGRYGKGDGTLMKWIKEDNPKFDSGLFSKLMVSIEANRTDFFNEQKKLTSMGNQRNNHIETFPGSFFCSEAEPIEVKIVSSTISKQVMKTGLDDNIDIFK